MTIEVRDSVRIQRGKKLSRTIYEIISASPTHHTFKLKNTITNKQLKRLYYHTELSEVSKQVPNSSLTSLTSFAPTSSSFAPPSAIEWTYPIYGSSGTVSTFIPQQRFTEHRSLRKEEKIEQETKKEMRQRQNEKRLQRELQILDSKR